jgi:hypothetical protein
MTEKDETKENESKPDAEGDSPEMQSRRDFLRGLGRWSAIIIGAAVGAANLLEPPKASGWVNSGGGWTNGRGSNWINNGGWINGGTSGGSWINGGRGDGGSGGGGGGWVNRNAGWINGGGGSWANSRGGWVNR